MSLLSSVSITRPEITIIVILIIINIIGQQKITVIYSIIITTTQVTNIIRNNSSTNYKYAGRKTPARTFQITICYNSTVVKRNFS